MAKSEASVRREQAGQAFARHFLQIIAVESHGEWLRYRDVYNRTVTEIPDNEFVAYISVHKRRRAVVSGTIAALLPQFPQIERRKEGTAQSALVWYRTAPSTLEIVTSRRAVSRAFSDWRRAMRLDARWTGTAWATPEGVLAATMPRQVGRRLGERVSLGLDPSGQEWTVQINQPTQPDTHNVHSAVARGQEGQRFLIRQGTLQRNRQSPERITGELFARRTGLSPVPVSLNGETSSRSWYVVADLDAESTAIRRSTVDFVERCHAARSTQGKEGQADDQRFNELLGHPEVGGGHLRKGRTTEDQTVLHLQGSVWRALYALLAAHNIEMSKPRHRDGYEVDAAIQAPDGPLLVEIKTSITAGDIQTGIGQLALYPRLLDRLVKYRRVLLVRGMPRSAMVAAIEACGVLLHSYEITVENEEVRDVRFSPEFLVLCGISSR